MNVGFTSSHDSHEGANMSILVVEDESITREFLSQIIKMKFPALRVLAAENGQAGLELFRKIETGLVLTDITMPVMDGIQMARQIRLDKPDVEIIALSAYSSLEGRADDLDKLFNGFISKPIMVRHLCKTIAGCVERNNLGRGENNF